MVRNRQLILIAGLPATGKTTIGNYLRDNYGFLHIDFEDGVSKIAFENNPEHFLANLKNHPKVVITWGFMPVKRNLLMVERLTSQNFSHVWLQANYLSSFLTFIRRERIGNLFSFIWQVSGIHFSKFSHNNSLKIVYPYDKQGHFRPLSKIISEVGVN